jgi:hypothetical protein
MSIAAASQCGHSADAEIAAQLCRSAHRPIAFHKRKAPRAFITAVVEGWPMESKTEFLLRRASEESLKAIAAGQPEAADAHEELAVRYSAKAIMALSDEDKTNAH